MTTREIADRVAALCKAGKYTDAIDELYAPEARQYENGDEIPGGRAALAKACRGWIDSRVVHGTEPLGVHVGTDTFVIEMRHDVTPHATKQRNQWSEAAVYRVQNGKITEIRFYYKPPAS